MASVNKLVFISVTGLFIFFTLEYHDIIMLAISFSAVQFILVLYIHMLYIILLYIIIYSYIVIVISVYILYIN